ncbi:MFS transporter [Demequina phytophila]|uniref:MFS transporter n=1 Tax=Demequina phytophila TaxID=1638981 RepID=UPI0007841CD4|nr:MFS transporter [Demequina phytophila]
MSASPATSQSLPVRTARLGVYAAYAAQGLGYATVVTALPQLKARYTIDDDTVSLITLTVVIGAAVGSMVADRVAVRLGSRAAVVLGLALQATALLAVAAPVPLPVFWALFGVYGVGLGCVDASAAMQGVIVQRRIGLAVMASFFAANTAASIVGALVMSAGAGTSLGASLGLAVAGVGAAAVAVAGRRVLDPVRERAVEAGGARPPLPLRGLFVVGMVVFAAFTADSTVSTWSTVHLADGVGASATVAPLGYAVYAGFTLLTRLTSDLVVRRYGRAHLAVVTVAVAIAGLILAGLVLTEWAALAGFALAGLGVGALVPLAYAAAGDLDPRRSDEIVARVNLFTYPGSLIGAVLPGLIASGSGMGASFLLAAVLLLPALGAVRHFRARGEARVA